MVQIMELAFELWNKSFVQILIQIFQKNNHITDT